MTSLILLFMLIFYLPFCLWLILETTHRWINRFVEWKDFLLHFACLFFFFFRALLLDLLLCLLPLDCLCFIPETDWIKLSLTGGRCTHTYHLFNIKRGFTWCWRLLLLCWWQKYFNTENNLNPEVTYLDWNFKLPSEPRLCLVYWKGFFLRLESCYM